MSAKGKVLVVQESYFLQINSTVDLNEIKELMRFIYEMLMDAKFYDLFVYARRETI